MTRKDEEGANGMGVCAAVHVLGSRSAIALYEIETHEIILHQIPPGRDAEVVSKFILEAAGVHTLVVSAKVKTVVERWFLRDREDESGFEENDLFSSTSPLSTEEESKGKSSELNAPAIKILRAQDFAYESALQRLASISTPEMPVDLGYQARLNFLASKVQMRDRLSVQTLGGLLSFLTQNHMFSNGVTDGPMQIVNIQQRATESFVLLGEQTLQALQVFRQSLHPALHGCGSGKESLSLFGISDYTRSFPGKRLLRTWFSLPSTHIATIQARQEMIKTLLLPAAVLYHKELQQALSCIKNVKGSVGRMLQAAASANDFSVVYKSAEAVLHMSEICKSLGPNRTSSNVLTKFIDNTWQVSVEHILDLLDSAINFEDSRFEGTIILKDGYNDDVDKVRHSYMGLDSFLTSIGVMEMKRMRELGLLLPKLHVIYYPQIGYLITIDKNIAENFEEQTEVSQKYDLEFMFSSDSKAYFKSKKMHELDNELGDIHGILTDLQARLTEDLVKECTGHFTRLLYAVEAAAELDCLLSLAIVAQEHGWICPDVFEGGDIFIEDGRHPLLELPGEPWVANTTESFAGELHVVTGPNMSGKSVYLKQVASIVYMAQLGSFVPAKNAKIGVVRSIFIKLTSLQSVSESRSTFFLDCSQVAAAMAACQLGRTLVIMDEYGKGTNGADGMCLLAAIFSHILNLKEVHSNFFVSTHFHEVIKLSMRKDPHKRLRVFSMRSIPKDTAFDQQTEHRDLTLRHDVVTHLYKLDTGILATESYAVSCALVCGVAKNILRRFLAVKQSMENGQPIEQADDDSGQGPAQRRRLASTAKTFHALDLEQGNFRSFLTELSED